MARGRLVFKYNQSDMDWIKDKLPDRLKSWEEIYETVIDHIPGEESSSGNDEVYYSFYEKTINMWTGRNHTPETHGWVHDKFTQQSVHSH